MTAEDIINKLGLKPLPVEGGYYRETYRSKEKIPAGALPTRYGIDKTLGTAIFYLLTPDTVSALHRVRSDEIFHFYLGDPVTMLQLLPDGSTGVFRLGQAIEKGSHVQVVVPAEAWQGCFLEEGGKYALMGTTVAPGFDITDFELGKRSELLKKYPEREGFIKRLT